MSLLFFMNVTWLLSVLTQTGSCSTATDPKCGTIINVINNDYIGTII